VGFVSVGKLFSGIAINTRARELVLPVLFFPIVIPLIIAAVKAHVVGGPVDPDPVCLFNSATVARGRAGWEGRGYFDPPVLLARDGSKLGAVLAGATLMLSFSVSYIRARAEGMGVECSEGWFTRTERVIVIALGLIFNQLIIALSIVSVLSLITATQRLYVTWRKLQPGQ
jgi:hypothetical protein